MAHEMGKHDDAVYFRKPAWHGLGKVLNSTIRPRDAFLECMPWRIVQKPLMVKFNGQQQILDTHVANFREDTQEFFNVVSSNYQVIQNEDVADFAEALADEGKGDVQVESAGSIQNGRRVWILLKGEQFSVKRDDDTIFPYIAIANGHDGSAAFRVVPTTVRVVCSNTLHMVVPRSDTGDLGSSAYVLKHTVNVMDRVEEAKQALQAYRFQLKSTKAVMDVLAAKDIDTEQMQKFFFECYTECFSEIPTNPKNAYEERRREKAMSAYNSFSQRFDDERSVAGATIWNALNAFTGMTQHDQKARGADDEARIEKRVDSNLFGLNQRRCQHALQKAFRWSISS